MRKAKTVQKAPRTGIVALAVALVVITSSRLPAFAEQVMIDGTSGMLPLTANLVQKFKAKNSSVPLEMGGGFSSSAAMRAVADDKISIGLSSEPVGDAERSAGLQSIEIARVAVVFGVHSSVSVTGLTSEQICNIYSGKVVNWKEVGGSSLSIVPLTRPVNEFDPTLIRKHISCFKESAGVVSLPRPGDMAKALSTKSGAIGMTNEIFVADSNGAIRSLAWNGVSPTLENVQAGSYPLTRRFYFVVKESPRGGAAQFLAFVKGVEGQKVITESKAVPVK